MQDSLPHQVIDGPAGEKRRIELEKRLGPERPCIQRVDYATAIRELRPLAEQGYTIAQFQLGVMYGKGQGVTQDYAEAVKWFRKAAEQGMAEAQINLGVMYGKGQGVPQDYAQAHMWYNLAVSRFPPGEERDQAVKNRNLVTKKMTPAQISEAQKLAREWKPKK